MLTARGWRVVKDGKPPPQTASTDATPEIDDPLPIVAGTAASMLPPLQQHAEGPGINKGNREDQTLPSLRSGGEGHVDSEEVRYVDLSADIVATAGITAEAEVTC